jgi:hypothetical protein
LRHEKLRCGRSCNGSIGTLGPRMKKIAVTGGSRKAGRAAARELPTSRKTECENRNSSTCPLFPRSSKTQSITVVRAGRAAPPTRQRATPLSRSGSTARASV